MHIAPAEARDMPAITAIFAQEVTHGLATFEEVPPSEADMTARWQGAIEAGYPFVVARAGERVLGYAAAGAFRPRPAYRFSVENSVYVAKDARGQGVGRTLLSEIVTQCEAGPWRQMVAVIGDSGNAGSIALHTSLGFTHRGILRDVGFKFGRWVDTVMMQRALSGPD